jgi:PEP-CTERM motif
MRCSVFTRRLSVLSVAATVGMIAALVGSSAHATLTWYDGFSLSGDGGDYVVTTAGPTDPLGGQSGGAGTFLTGGPWIQAGGDDAWVQANSLERTFQDNTPAQIVPSVGGSVADDPGPRTGCCNTQRNGMAMTTPWGGFDDPDGTFYMSFLANFGEGPTLQHRVIEWWDGGVGDSNIVLRFGIAGFSGEQELRFSVKDAVSGTNTQVADLGPGTSWDEIQGITEFALLKFDMSTSGQDTISLYLNPVGDEGSNTPNAQISVDQFLMSHLGAFSAFVYGPGVEPSFDELRVGTEWADVQNNTAPHYWNTPEPASLCLVALGAMGLLVVRRRK